ncbi:MAG TPA: hypothetical protein VKP03_02090 [Patescibacteria group bacterium]|nr:hypothetical protein [Patescibacteria group bacterium]
MIPKVTDEATVKMLGGKLAQTIVQIIGKKEGKKMDKKQIKKELRKRLLEKSIENNAKIIVFSPKVKKVPEGWEQKAFLYRK